MKPPIIINDSPWIDTSGDLRVYASVALAERSIEVNDAEDDQLHAFDSEGLLLRIVANEDGRGGAHLEAGEMSPHHRETLQAILRNFLVRLGEPASTVDVMTLENLIRAAYQMSPDPYSG